MKTAAMKTAAIKTTAMKQILQYFWEEMKPYKWWYLLLFQTLLFSPLHTIIINYSSKLLIDRIIETPVFDIAKFYLPIFLYIFAEVYINIVWRLSNFAGMNCVPQTLNAIHLKSYNYVTHHSYKFFTENLSGSIISKIDGIVNGFSNLRDGIHFRLGGAISNIIIYAIAIIWVAPKLGAVIILWAIPLFFIVKKLALKLGEANKNESDARHEARGLIADRITNIFNLFNFAARKRELEKLEAHINTHVLPKQKNVWKWEIIFHTIGAAFYVFLLGVVMSSVVYFRYFGGISVGDVVFVLGISWSFMNEVWRASTEFGAFMKDMGDVKSAFSIIQIPNEKIDKQDAILLKI